MNKREGMWEVLTKKKGTAPMAVQFPFELV